MPTSKAEIKPRPARLVASKRTPAGSKPIAASNSINSPLLRLAPELRNRIYELVLCGKTLHFEGYRKAVKICSHFGDSATYEDYLVNHAKCVVGATYCTSLLQVCRQVNEETALIPFTSNTFALRMTNRHLWLLIDVLLPAQRKAVKRLELRADGRFQVDGTKVKQLTGLRDLKVDLFSAGSSLEERAMDLERLGNGRLKSVKVSFLPLFTGSSRLSIPDRPPNGFATWAARLEQKLLDQTSYSEWNKKASVELEKARASSRGERKARKARKAEQNKEKDEANSENAATREHRGMRALH